MDPPVVKLKTGRCQIYFTRHAESKVKSDFVHHSADSPLSELGYRQAAKLTGHFDLVLCSPLHRALETLRCSKITYNRLQIVPRLREFKLSRSDCFTSEADEDFEPETVPELEERCSKFHEKLQFLCDMANDINTENEYKILIVGHSGFFNCWYYGEKDDWPPDNADIMKLF
jgi:broad specificity phosphatase PhoE